MGLEREPRLSQVRLVSTGQSVCLYSWTMVALGHVFLDRSAGLWPGTIWANRTDFEITSKSPFESPSFHGALQVKSQPWYGDG